MIFETLIRTLDHYTANQVRMGILNVAPEMAARVKAFLPPGHAVVAKARPEGLLEQWLIEGPLMPLLVDGKPATLTMIIRSTRIFGPPIRRFARWSHREDEWEGPPEPEPPGVVHDGGKVHIGAGMMRF